MGQNGQEMGEKTGKIIVLVVVIVTAFIILSRFRKDEHKNIDAQNIGCQDTSKADGLDSSSNSYIGKKLYFFGSHGYGWDKPGMESEAGTAQEFVLDTLWRDKKSLRGGAGTFTNTKIFKGNARIIFDTRYVAKYDFDSCISQYNITLGQGAFVYNDSMNWLTFKSAPLANGFGTIKAKK
jgi:hypothetical protein